MFLMEKSINFNTLENLGIKKAIKFKRKIFKKVLVFKSCNFKSLNY